ncbi:MAG: helix-turn-helix domain-containing protein [Thermodesulfobacteriota bacterium]|jgi:excisionase family DNA binding protein|nr:helix-turn-helix domain-containing protein [Thermodesulfobacteriota bacterium]
MNTRQRLRKFVSTGEIAEMLEVSPRTIRNWINKGDIKAYKIGQNLKIPAAEVVQMLQRYDQPIPEWLKGGDA